MPPESQPPQLMPPEQLEFAAAEAPFDDAQADLILRSSDEVPVHFRVFKNILSLASPVFADMSSIPSPSPPPEKPHDEVQVVPLSEHSTALDMALRHIYPVQRTPMPDALHCASILAEFSRKYQVEALYQFIIGYLKDGIDDDPVGVYAIAVTYGYDDVGADAARLCLDLPFSDLQSSYLRYATAEHISELFKYHVACGQAASALATSNRSWFSLLAQTGILNPQGPQRRINCQSCLTPDFVNQTSSERKSGPLSVWNYFHRSALALAHRPTSEVVIAEDFVLQTNDCPTCAQFVRPYLIELSVKFVIEIENAIEQVPLPKAVSVGSGSATTATDSGSGSD